LSRGIFSKAIAEHHLDVVGIFDDMVVGQDMTLCTDDHATAQATRVLLFLFAVEELEPRVLAMWVLAFALAGIDAHHRWGGFLCWPAQTADGPIAADGRWGLQQSHAVHRALGTAQPFGLERGHHKPDGQQNGHPLRE
jgi:hypothetical protein